MTTWRDRYQGSSCSLLQDMTRGGTNGPIIIPTHHSKVDHGTLKHTQQPKDMDDYYFRPRGEFLTRGAALASAQLVTPDYGVSAGITLL